MAFALEPADEEFLRTAPQRYVFAMNLPVPASTIWDAAMAGERPLTFVHGLKVRWTSPAPRGIGSTRVAHTALGAIRLQERYIVWDEGHRNAFAGVGVNVPVFRRFGEDYVVEPTPDGCRFTWTFAAEARGPRAAAMMNDVIQKGLFANMARDVRKHFGGTAA
jgi:hypothetical protein